MFYKKLYFYMYFAVTFILIYYFVVVYVRTSRSLGSDCSFIRNNEDYNDRTD